ncbi:MAG: hypothetical protein QOJ62_2891 [Actinomycetota bacterium]|nr:hypothetical protein [Actinomycetota bacterium]
MQPSRLGDVFRLRGMRRLLGFALMAELPAGMTGLAVLLRITQAGGSYARAGLVTAVGALATGVTSPILSRMVDRRGQTVVLVPTAIAVLAASIFLAVLPPRGALAPLLVASALMGFVQPPALVSARTLWPTVVTDPLLLETTYSIEASLTELVFICGPLLVVAINAPFGAAAAIVASGALACTGALGFGTSKASRRVTGSKKLATTHHALRAPGVRLMVFVIFAMVIGFAAIDVSTVAAARELSASKYTPGIVIAIWSIGSLVGGMVFGMRSWPGVLSARILAFLAGIVVLTAALIPLHNLVGLAIVLFAGGLNYAPCFANMNMIVQRVAPVGAVTESYAWMGTGALIGAAVGSSSAGFAVTKAGVGAGYVVATSAVVLALGVVWFGRAALRASDRAKDDRGATSLAGSVG